MNEGRIKTLDTFMEKPELILDPKGNILNVTNRPKKIWGYYTEELIGKSLICLLDTPYHFYGMQMICGRIGNSKYGKNTFTLVVLPKYGEKIKVNVSVKEYGDNYKVTLSKESRSSSLAAS